MPITFNTLIRRGQPASRSPSDADIFLNTKDASDTVVFMSHKTGDSRAEFEAKYIAQTHGVNVYMAEWDEDVDGDSPVLPDHIMRAIKQSNGFLVHVRPDIGASMWIGYEIGGAHAMQKRRARIMYNAVYRLPSVVAALERLSTREALDQWITTNIVSHRTR